MSAVFVTGSGTEVGKTYVTCGLLRTLRTRGIAVDARKFVLSGFDPEDASGSDAALLLDALARPASAAEIERIAPWRFRAPLSPDLAAAREGRSIDFAALAAASRAAVDASAERFVAIEGVGGVRVPLTATRTVADWIDEVAVPVVLVGGTYLGAISHTLTAYDVLRARGATLAAIVCSESLSPPISPEETCAAIARFTPGTPVLAVPRDGGDERFEELARHVPLPPAP